MPRWKRRGIFALREFGGLGMSGGALTRSLPFRDAGCGAPRSALGSDLLSHDKRLCRQMCGRALPFRAAINHHGAAPHDGA
jgi:hypothetical protein